MRNIPKNRLWLIIVIVILVLSFVIFLIINKMQLFNLEEGESWYNGEETGINVTDKETALQAFLIHYSDSNSYLKKASKNLTVDYIYFGTIRNITIDFFDEIPELKVWKLNDGGVFYNTAVDENGTIYIGGIITKGGEVKRAT